MVFRSRRPVKRTFGLLLAVIVLFGVGVPVALARTSRSSHPAHVARVKHKARGTKASTASLKLVWSSEFNGAAGSAPASVWNVRSGAIGWTNGTLQSYTTSSSNVALDGHGDLALILRKQQTTGTDGITEPYTSGYVETGQITNSAYGSVQARIWLPAGAGLWPAFWMVGDDYAQVGWPQSGEIDVLEANGSRPGVAMGSLHGPEQGASGGYALHVYDNTSGSWFGAWHIWSINWTSTAISFLVDGHIYGTIAKSQLRSGWGWKFDQPFNVILNLAVTNYYGSLPAASNLPAKMLIDWVRIYQ